MLAFVAGMWLCLNKACQSQASRQYAVNCTNLDFLKLLAVLQFVEIKIFLWC